MLGFLKSLGLPLSAASWPDYFATAPGARADRSIVVPTYDGRQLGDRFILMRERL